MGAHTVPPYDNSKDQWPATRKEALAAGRARYFTGEPCVYGHVYPRYANNYVCAACSKLHTLYEKTKNPTRAKELKAKFRAENPGVHAERARIYRAKNLEKVRAREAAHRRSDKDIYRLKSTKRRARKRGASGSHTSSDVEDILKTQKYKCACCKASIKARRDRHIDHIIPLAKGGGNGKGNLQILCISCNLEKGDKVPEDFMRIKGFLI